MEGDTLRRLSEYAEFLKRRIGQLGQGAYPASSILHSMDTLESNSFGEALSQLYTAFPEVGQIDRLRNGLRQLQERGYTGFIPLRPTASISKTSPHYAYRRIEGLGAGVFGHYQQPDMPSGIHRASRRVLLDPDDVPFETFETPFIVIALQNVEEALKQTETS